MHVHTNVLTRDDLQDALNVTGLSARGVHLDYLRGTSEHRSRKRARRLTFYLVADEGHGRRWANSGQHGAGPSKAATWHEWGAFLAELFYRDPDAVSSYYDGARDFEEKAVRPWQGDEARTLEDWRTMFVGAAV